MINLVSAGKEIGTGSESIYVFRTGKSEFFLKTCEAALKCRLILLLCDEGGGPLQEHTVGFLTTSPPDTKINPPDK